MKRPLKVGVLGIGNMGKNHLRVLSSMQEYNLIGCFDVNQDMVEQQAQLYGIYAFSSAEELLSKVEVAHIVTPSILHKSHALLAAEAGCHVLVEKPIALNIDDARQIVAVCDESQVRLCVGHVERYNPAIRALSQILFDEEMISISFTRMSPFDKRISDASVVQDLMIHDIDILNSISESNVVDVVAQGAKVFTDKLDYAQALVRFENGFCANLIASRVTETKIRRAEVNCKNAFIFVDYLNRIVEISRKTSFMLNVGHSIQYSQENIIEKVLVPIAEPLRNEFSHFAECIKNDMPIMTSGEMAVEALTLCEQISEKALP